MLLRSQQAPGRPLPPRPGLWTARPDPPTAPLVERGWRAAACNRSVDVGSSAPIALAAFDAGAITSDAGALLLGATDRAIRMMDRFASCFHDERRADLIEHEVATLVGQRVFGIALGYEDLNDHDELRHDPLMAVLAGKLAARREDCAPVAGKSTLNRLELSRLEPTRYHKISHNPMAIKRLLVDLFLEAHERAPSSISIRRCTASSRLSFSSACRHNSDFHTSALDKSAALRRFSRTTPARIDVDARIASCAWNIQAGARCTAPISPASLGRWRIRSMSTLILSALRITEARPIASSPNPAAAQPPADHDPLGVAPELELEETRVTSANSWANSSIAPCTIPAASG